MIAGIESDDALRTTACWKKITTSVAAMNAADDGFAGLQELGGNATLLFYNSEEGNEGRQAYLEKRKPDFSKFKRLP